VARKTQEFEKTESYGDDQAKRIADTTNQIRATFEALSSQVGPFVQQSQTENETERTQRHVFQRKELFWTRFAAVAATVFSIASVTLSVFTVLVLDSTLGVYRGQATIMATQAALYKEANRIAAINLAPNVIVGVAWIKPEDYFSLTFTNVGHSTAYNLTIAPKTNSRTPEPNFDPFKSLDWSVPTLRAIEDLSPGEPTVSKYSFSRPSIGEILYLWGTYSYEGRVPEAPKETRRFCYMAENGGEVWPCNSVQIIYANVRDSAQSRDGASIQIVKPTPTPTISPAHVN
jgi:hypothetical protein